MNLRRPPLRFRHTTVVAAFATTAALVTVTAPAQAAGSWYVDRGAAGCSDTGPGSQATPFCTVSAAAKVAIAAGDSVQVAPGVYREQVTVAGSGASGTPIRFTATGPGVVLSGTRDLSAATWTAATGTAFSTPYAPPAAPKQVFLDGSRLLAASSPSTLSAGSWAYDSTAKVLYLDLGGASPAGRAIEAGAQNFGVTMTGRSNVEITGFTATGQNLAGFRALTSPSVTWKDVVSEDSGANGVLIDGSTGGAVVDNATSARSLSTGIKVNASTASIVRNSSSHHSGLHGIGVSNSPRTTLDRNASWANTAVSPTATAAGIDVSGTSTDAVITRNRSRDNQDSGIQVYSGAHRALVARNVAWDNGDHGFDTLASTGVRYLNNTSVHNNRDGISIEGGSTGAVVANNILVDNGAPTREYNLYVSTDSTTGFSGDYDLIVNHSVLPVAKYGGVVYKSLFTFSAATGQEAHGLAKTPAFVDRPAADFRLSGGSAAVDSANAGVTDFVSDDAAGLGPQDDALVPDTGAGTPTYADRGALESVPGTGANYAPHAALVVDPDALAVPPSGTVTADASASADADTAPITGYEFNWGDGSAVTSGSQPTATHDYTGTGSYTVTVTVTDQNGLTDTASRTVTVTARDLATLHVEQGATNCSDTADGSTATPLCTIGAATRKALAGDTILVGPGNYREQVTFTSTGQAGAPITIRGTGAGVALVGSEDRSAQTDWTATGSSAWSHAWTPAVAPAQVWLDGNPLTTATSAAAMTSGSWFYDSSTKTVLVDVGGGNPASGHTVSVGARNYGFLIRGRSHIDLSGFEVREQNLAAVYLDQSDHLSVHDLSVTRAGSYGVTVDASHHVTLAGLDTVANGSIGVRFNNSEDSTLSGSTSSRNRLHGVSVQNSRRVTVSRVVARDNDKPDARGAVGIDVSLGSTDVVVERSTASGNDDSGFESFTGAAGTVFRRNLAYDNGDHGIDTSGATGTVAVANTVVGNATAGINFEGGATGSSSRNNIVVDNAIGSTRTVGEIRVDQSSESGTTLDRDLVFHNGGGVLFEWRSQPYADLAGFQAVSGQQARGLAADPSFTDLTGRVLTLTGDSPAIDAADSGVTGWLRPDRVGQDPLDNPGVDDTGTGPDAVADLGALEYVGPVARAALTPRTGVVPLTVHLDGNSSRALGAALTGSAPAGFRWDCGNGTTVSGATGDCSYPVAGNYTVTLTLTDEAGLRDTWTDTVAATADQAPTAALTVTPATGYVPQDVVLDASGSADAEGPIASYTFSCGNGTAAVTQTTATKACRYTTAGTFTARVTVTDSAGMTGTTTRQVSIAPDAPPTAVLTLSTNQPRPGAPVQVDGLKSTDADNTPIASYRFQCGNGVNSPVQTSPSFTCYYPIRGRYTVTLRVTDTAGLSATQSKQVNVR